MPVCPGTRLGSHEILAPLGAGGMGEVYRARDTKLGREVALKILPEAFAGDPDRLMRFEREARTLAALNHPNIAQVYGLEDDASAQPGGATRALVMELVEGDDLSARIARGPIPLDEALPIARQIAEALEAAHEAGIIHRDLKPANIKVRDDGTVKVLDFGLAKALETNPASATAGASGATITSPAMTHAGVILGTAAYMAPEQAKGRPVDRRADIWAFGCVLYEMLAGRRPFKGDDITDTITAVLRDEPDWQALPPATPAHVKRVLRRCLEKDARQRMRDIGDVRLELAGASGLAAEAPSGAPTSGPGRHSRGQRVALVAASLAAGAIIASATTVWLAGRSVGPAPTDPPVRFTIAASTGAEQWRITTDRPLALSPDGRALVYRVNTGDRPQLVVRSLDALEPRVLANTDLPRAPVFSPDSQWVAFFVGSELRKVRVSGGPAVTVARANVRGGLVAGASWGDDDAIVYAVHQPRGAQTVPGLWVVPAAGGEPKALTTVDPARGEGAHAYPFVLPGSRGVLFKVQATGQAPSQGRLMVLDRATGEQREVVPVGSAAEYANGHVVYADERGRLHAMPFDVLRLRPSGSATPLAEEVHVPAVGQPLFSLSASGALAFVSAVEGASPETTRSLAWVDRQGRETALAAPPRTYEVARLSPDGSQIALDIRDQENDIWIWSIARSALSRLTRGATLDMAPVWTPDGQRIVWTSTSASSNPMLFWQAADGTGAPERLSEPGAAAFPASVTPDGRHLLFSFGVSASNSGIDRLRLDHERRIETVLRAASVLATPDVSPDGRWLAYASDESGQSEIYVRPYPAVDGGRWQISSEGGTRPLWSRDGRELFFLDAEMRLAVAPMAASGGGLAPGVARRLLASRYHPGFSSRGLALRGYDVSPDGQRFLMIRGAETGESHTVVTIALNWSPGR